MKELTKRNQSFFVFLPFDRRTKERDTFSLSIPLSSRVAHGSHGFTGRQCAVMAILTGEPEHLSSDTGFVM